MDSNKPRTPGFIILHEDVGEHREPVSKRESGGMAAGAPHPPHTGPDTWLVAWQK